MRNAESANLKIIFFVKCSLLAAVYRDVSRIAVRSLSVTPYHYAMLKVGHLPPVKCPHRLPQSNAPSWSLASLVKAHTKLPIQLLATYPCLAAGYRNGDHCEIRVCG